MSDQLSPGESFDVVVVGSGIGGLSCGALLAYYGFKVGGATRLGVHMTLVVRKQKGREGHVGPVDRCDEI
jgi:ribulose 1,5-bisphosphate synthetase/thiazole synthase